MADSSDIINNIIDQNSVGLQDNFGQMMLDKIRDVVADRKMEIAQSFLGVDRPEDMEDTEEMETDEDMDDEDLEAEDIEAETDEIGDDEESTQDEEDTNEEN